MKLAWSEITERFAVVYDDANAWRADAPKWRKLGFVADLGMYGDVSRNDPNSIVVRFRRTLADYPLVYFERER